MTEDIEMVWENPPEKPGSQYRVTAEQLVAHPGKWARVAHEMTQAKALVWRNVLKRHNANITVRQHLIAGKTGESGARVDVYACYEEEKS